MKTKHWTICLLPVVALLLFTNHAAGALASDLSAPTWRGDAYTTYQLWEFDTADPTPNPNAWNNSNFGGGDWQWDPYYIIPGPGQGWYPGWPGWGLSGWMPIPVPNWPFFDPWWKRIIVQVEWKDMGLTVPVTPGITLLDPDPGLIVSVAQLGQDIPLIGPWMHSTYEITITGGSPALDVIQIAGEIGIDNVIIDTIAIPEPITIMLLATGAVAALRRRR